MTAALKSGVHFDVHPDVYYGDPCAEPSLNHTVARALIDGTPFAASCKHPKLSQSSDTASTKAQNKGTLWHKLALGKGKEIVIVDADDWRTKAAREAHDEAVASGKIPALQHEYDEAQSIAGLVNARIKELAGGEFEPETVVIGRVQAGAGSIWVRCMCDAFVDHGTSATIIDLKTTADLSDDAITRRLQEYDTQAAFYPMVLGAARPELLGRIRFVFLFVSTTEPFEMRAVEVSEAWLHSANELMKSAVNKFAEHLDRKVWPSFSTDIQTFHPPPWLINRRFEMGAPIEPAFD